LTDLEGRWEIAGLPEGEYFPQVQKAGYVQTGGLRPGANALTASDRERVLEIRLAPGAVLRGKVVDRNGEPIDDLRVMALQSTRGPDGGMTFAQFSGGEKTNDLGEFRLYGLREGEYVLVAARMGGRVITQRGVVEIPTYYPNATSPDEAQVFTLAAGAEYSDLVIELQSAQGVKVSGRVVSSSGIQAHASAQLRSAQGGAETLRFHGMSSFVVGPDGTLSGGPIPAGRYTLSVQTMNLKGEREAGIVDLVVGESDISGLVVETRPPTRISGRVITDPPGRPLPHPIQLGPATLRQHKDAFHGGEGGTAMPDGTFEIKSYYSPVRVQQGGPIAGWTVKAVRWKGEDVTTTGLNFTPGDAVVGVEVVLGRLASRITGTVAGLRSHVADDEEREGAVLLFRRQPGETDDRPGGMASIRNGAYVFNGLPAGTYQIVAVEGDGRIFMRSPQQIAALTALAVDVSVGDDETKVVNLKIVSP
jgi:hypothetical protein